jgi:hypothetical protein
VVLVCQAFANLYYYTGQASRTTVTLYDVFPPGEILASETMITVAEPEITIGPGVIGSDGKTRYLYDVVEPGVTYTGTWHFSRRSSYANSQSLT